MVENKKDKRHFSRYRRKSNFRLNIGSKFFQAETIDYSLGGVGAKVQDSPPINIGDTIDIDIPQSSLKFKGRVVRLEKSALGLEIGILRLSPLEGSLRDFRPSDILLGLQRSGRTGILDVTSGTVWKSIYINAGDMVFASSNQDSDRLGEMLLQEGKITHEQHKKSLDEMAKTNKRQGAVLVQLGFLKPQELLWAVQHSVENIILSLFILEDGGFEFREGPLPASEVITLRLSCANLIYRGIKRIKNLEYITSHCPPADSKLCFSSNPLNLFQDIKLDDVGKRILTYVDGKTAIKDIISLLHQDEAEAIRSIFGLLNTRIIEVMETEERPVEISPEDVLGKQEEEAEQGLIGRIDEMHQRHLDMGYYGVLSVKDTATKEEIKRAYYRMAKEFHPDKHFHLPPEMKDKLNALFSYITTAYSTLTNPEQRKEYDRTLLLKPEKLGSNVDAAIKKFEQGMVELKRDKFAEAARLFAEAAYLDSSIAKYHYHYGLILNRLGKHKEAEKALQRALRLDPQNADYLAEAGYAYLELGFPVRAKGNFEKALKVKPTNKRAKEGLTKIGMMGQ